MAGREACDILDPVRMEVGFKYTLGPSTVLTNAPSICFMNGEACRADNF